jgi:hypothetical protein
MKTISLQLGRRVLANDSVVEILWIPSLSKILVRHLGSGKISTVSQGSVRAEIMPGREVNAGD